MRLLRRRKKEEAAGEEPGGTEAERGPATSVDGADAPPVEAEATTTGTGVTPAARDGEDAAATDADEAAAPGDAALATAEGQEEQEVAAASAPAPVDSAPPVPEEGDGETRLPPSFYFEGLLKNERPPSRDELDRQAEAEFRAAIAPSVERLRELAPDASSPEEALRQLTERWEDPLPDPEAERLRGQDQFQRGPADTAVYYRIRRHFYRPSRHVGFGREAWRPPPGLAGEGPPRRGRSGRQALSTGERSRRS